MYLHKALETLTRPEIEKLQLERLQKTCLLYTSRCVEETVTDAAENINFPTCRHR